jgi:hypothetical protein
MSKRHPTWQVLEQIEAGLPSLASRPIQLIWAMKDWCFRPECLDRFVTHWPQAEVHRLEDCGHYVVEDAHERIVPLVKGENQVDFSWANTTIDPETIVYNHLNQPRELVQAEPVLGLFG